MDPARLRETLTILKDQGVKYAEVPFVPVDGAGPVLFKVEFLPVEPPEAVTPFVDKDGKPVDLDEGAGPLARDPDADLESANFPRPGRGG